MKSGTILAASGIVLCIILVIGMYLYSKGESIKAEGLLPPGREAGDISSLLAPATSTNSAPIIATTSAPPAVKVAPKKAVPSKPKPAATHASSTNSDLPSDWVAASTPVSYTLTTTQNFTFPSDINVHPGDTAVSKDGQYKIRLDKMLPDGAVVTMSAGSVSDTVTLRYSPVSGPQTDTGTVGDMQATLIGSGEGDAGTDAEKWTQIILSVSKVR